MVDGNYQDVLKLLIEDDGMNGFGMLLDSSISLIAEFYRKKERKEFPISS